jgi:SH3-like domain-containing protein
MSAPHDAIGLQGWRGRLACAAFLLLALLPAASAQTTGAGTLHPPSKQKSPPAAAPTAPLAAPRPPVQQVGKPPPLIKPKGPAHAQPAPPAKPGAKAASKPGAKLPAAAAAGAAAAAAAGAATAAAPAEPAKGTVTSMPLPRFAALRSDEVNLRTGPGVRYPIDWVYKRRDLPVQIEREFEVWRLVRDQDGVKGWVHQATLTGRRSFVVTGAERVLHRQAGSDATAVARLQPGVVGHIRACEAAAEWCQVQVGDYKGWLRRDEFWGILPNEAIN